MKNILNFQKKNQRRESSQIPLKMKKNQLQGFLNAQIYTSSLGRVKVKDLDSAHTKNTNSYNIRTYIIPKTSTK